MNSPRVLSWILVWLCASALSSSYADQGEELVCLKSQSFLAPPDSSESRKYAPDRDMDILHLALDVTPDFKQRTVAGKVVITFKPIAKPLPELELDAVDLHVQSVTAT